MTAKNANTELTYELAHELLSADFESGILTWKNRDRKWFKTEQAYKMWNKRFPYKIASSNFANYNGKKYYQIMINYKNYLAHRVIWFMKNNYWPEQIDHISGNGLDNRLCNLREVSSSENHKNRRLSSNNTSGCTGVYWVKKDSKWRVRIRAGEKNLSLGYFNDYFLACCARKSAEYKHGFHKNHGMVRPL